MSRITTGRRTPSSLLPALAAALLAASLASAAPTALAEGVLLAPAPAWVDEMEVPEGVEPPESARGEHVLLHDRQVHAAGEQVATFTRTARRILDASGAASYSHVSWDFDPAYQTLTVHEVAIFRDGDRLERLDPDEMEVIQREPQLELRLHDGHRTAVLVLPDVRVGDVLVTAATIRGTNPVLGPLWSGRVPLAWSVPVERFRWRGIFPRERVPEVLLVRTTNEPRRRELPSGEAELEWSGERIEPHAPPERVPAWIDPWPHAELSQHESWADVVDWGLPLYRTTGRSGAARELVRRAQASAASAADAASVSAEVGGERDPVLRAARAALEIVQDEVRYLGIQDGPFAYEPAAPDEVWSRRHGDCKGKTMLLLATLKHLGLDVAPTLVDTRSGRSLDERLPSPSAFDHVIVRLRHDGRTLWLDGTATHQRGPLAERHVPDLGWALVLAPGVTDLESVEPRGTGRVVVVEDVESHGLEAPADYRVETRFTGAEADSNRSWLARRSSDQVLSAYAQYYGQQYPDIEALSFEADDDEEANVLTTVERYRIPRLWERRADTGRFEASFVDMVLEGKLDAPPSGERHLPLAATHPVDYRSTRRMHLHSTDWDIDVTPLRVAGPAFELEQEGEYRDRLLTLHTRFRTTAPSVPPTLIALHREAIEQSLDAAQWGLWHDDGTVAPDSSGFEAARGLVLVALAMGTLAAIGIAGALFVAGIGILLALAERRRGA